MGSNLHFFNHQMRESEFKFIRSKYNADEAKLMLSFCKYLIANKYHPEEITILTLYTGQLIYFKKLIKDQGDSLSEVTISTVDNYQGEENEIILLSLVRSNKNDSIGFLKVSNRVCVALSRARKGTLTIFVFVI
jgi:superfamily I DNA and/or RNA helicase